MKRLLLVLALAGAPAACGTMDVQQDPVTGKPVVVNPETGQSTGIVEAGETALNLLVPGLGTGLLLIGGGLMSRKMKKPAPTTTPAP